MSNEIEKAKLGAQTLTLFCKQFSEDVYGKILLEVLLEGIINEETVFVFGESEQTGDQTNHSTTGTSISSGASEQCGDIETAADLGKTNYPNHL